MFIPLMGNREGRTSNTEEEGGRPDIQKPKELLATAWGGVDVFKTRPARGGKKRGVGRAWRVFQEKKVRTWSRKLVLLSCWGRGKGKGSSPKKKKDK